MRKINEQVERITDMLLERAEHVTDGTVPLVDRTRVMLTLPPAFLDALVELDTLAYAYGRNIRDKARLHPDERLLTNVGTLEAPRLEPSTLSPGQSRLVESVRDTGQGPVDAKARVGAINQKR